MHAYSTVALWVQVVPAWRLYSDAQQFLSCHGTQEKDQFRLVFEPWLLCASTQILDKTVTQIIVLINHAVELMMPLWDLNGLNALNGTSSMWLTWIGAVSTQPARMARWLLLPPGCLTFWLTSWYPENLAQRYSLALACSDNYQWNSLTFINDCVLLRTCFTLLWSTASLFLSHALTWVLKLRYCC